MRESRIKQTEEGEKYVDGYFLTLEQLQNLVKDYCKDNFDIKLQNDQLYILEWLNNNKI